MLTTLEPDTYTAPIPVEPRVARPSRTPVELAREAKRLIDHPDLWCQRAAETVDGRICSQTALARALVHQASTPGVVAAYRTVHHVWLNLIGQPMWMYNDLPWNTHADVMAAWDRVIAALEP